MISQHVRLKTAVHYSFRSIVASARNILLALAFVGAALLAPHANAVVSAAIVTSNPTPTTGGAAFSWTITLTNNATAASNVMMTFPLPSGALFLNYAIASAQAGSYSCIAPEYSSTGTLVCEAPTLAANALATLTIVSRYEPDIASGVRTASVRVVGSGSENNASVQQNIVNSAALSLSATATANASAGSPVLYRLLVNNGAASAAINPLLQDTLPVGLTFSGVYATGDFHGTCGFDPATRIVSCTPKSLSTGFHSVTIVTRSGYDLAAGTLNNSATLATGVGTVTGSPASASTNITN